MAVVIRGKKGPATQRVRKRKMPSSSLHSQGVAVSINERVEDLVRRYPALQFSFGSLLLEGEKAHSRLPALGSGQTAAHGPCSEKSFTRIRHCLLFELAFSSPEFVPKVLSGPREIR